MASLADKAILSGAVNRPPMLEKDMYDSWKSRMEFYMLNRQHGRMILELVEHGPLLWPTIEADGVTRLKKYFELSAAEDIQADCDVKATNIILQALPSKIYALVSTHKVAKDLWERIQMLMQGMSLTKQERESKLYNEFDKFAYQKGETLCDFFLRFSLLLNDINMYNMKLEQFQVNTKFLNTLPPEWRPSSSTHSISYLVPDTSLLVNHNAYMASSSAPQIDYALMVQHSSEYSPPETRLVVPVFQKRYDPIDAINHMMSFLTAVVTSRIGRSNFRLPSDIQSKEPTLQVVYDVLRGCPFFKAFLVTADVPKIYMQELWATAYVHQHSIRFKMDSKKNIFDLEAFREMLHISPRVPGQSFDELPFEEEILDFLRFRLSQAQILWGLYHKRNIDYAFLIWEDFVYQVEHKNQKKSNEMYYPRFTKVIIQHFMTKKPSIPRRNKVNWHYVRDDILFSTIKVVSRHQNTQQYYAILPIELTTEDIRNTKAYKEYYTCATGEAAPKPKASARRKKSDSDASITPPTATPTPITTVAAALRLTAAAKEKQPAKAKSPYDPSEVERTE
nr:hypothetical protein [Tanacetum cinerariifolium]